MFVDDLGLDAQLALSAKERVWRDDGMLPAASCLNYIYARHRPITGQKELSLRGFEVSTLKLRGISDQVLAGEREKQECQGQLA